MIVLQGSLIPCRITGAQNCHPLSRVFLSLFLCRIFCLSGYNLLDRVFRFAFQVQQISLYFFHSGSGDDRNLFFMSISLWAFNFFPLLFCMFFNVFTPGQVNILSFDILSYRVPAFPSSVIQFVHYAVLLVLYCGSKAEVSFYGNFYFLTLTSKR